MRKAFYVGILAASGLRAAGYCSLLVKVQDQTGKGVDARVAIEEENGGTSVQTTRRGETRFCGLGITPVSVAVGNPECYQVIVRSVALEWNKTQTVAVIYDGTACKGERLPVAACAFLLRFADSTHDPVGSASFKAEKPFPNSYSGDEYGRMFVRIAAGQELSGVVSAAGYKPTPVSIPCVSKNQRLEQVVVLEKSGR